MDLKITDDKVREAAKQCSDADKVLRTLFPEAFEKGPVPFMRGQKPICFRIDTGGLLYSLEPRSAGARSKVDGAETTDSMFLPAVHGYAWAIEEDSDYGTHSLTLRRCK